MKARLTEDIYSAAKRLQYGKKDEVVLVIAEFVNVLIVQNSSGNKFPVHRDKAEILSAF